MEEEKPAGPVSVRQEEGALYLDPDLSQGAVLFVKVQRRAVSLSRMGDTIEPDQPLSLRLHRATRGKGGELVNAFGGKRKEDQLKVVESIDGQRCG